MGITIHHTLGQEVGYIKKTLDNAEKVAAEVKQAAAAIGIEVEYERNGNGLRVNVQGCETLSLDFMTAEDLRASRTYYDPLQGAPDLVDKAHRGEHYERWPDQKMLWSTGFCKTQYAPHVGAHRFVAEILRAAASHCVYAEVNDEGDYYHTGSLDDAAEAIGRNGALIGALGEALTGAGFEAIPGGETTIKPRKTAGDRYNIIRIYAPHLNKSSRIIRKGVSLEEAQEHCRDPKTRKEGKYFDGYDKA